MKLYFININSIGATPLMSYIVKYFSKIFDITIVESFIEKSDPFSYVKKRRYIRKAKNSYAFNKQNIFNKLYKYFFVSFCLIKHSFKRKKLIIYSVDFQVVAVALMLKKWFRKKNLKIIYHQFELIDVKSLGKENVFFFRKMQRFAKLIDLVIVPEKNRLEILLKQLSLPKEKSFYFPNINAINTLSQKKHKLFEKLPKGAKIIGHIGSIGMGHYIYNFIEAIKKTENSNFFFLFVGKQNQEIKKLASKTKLKNIIFVDEVPHSELKEIYSFLDLGFILYKGIDDNFEYCAPNKLYEYWAYGVPVIAHKLRGLEHEFNNPIAGKLINFENSNEIANATNEYLKKNNRKDIIKYYQKNYFLNHFLSGLSGKTQNL